MDPIKTIGTFLKGSEERDAIHIAVLPVVAGEDMSPGNRVALAYGTADVAIQARDEYGVLKSIGIADPFISHWQIKKGQRFWLFLHPNTVTGMRHHWEHPSIGKPIVATESELWLHQFAERWGFDYDEMMEVATNPTSGMDYITAHGHDLHSRGELGFDHQLFWQHLAVVTGRTFDETHQGMVEWSCSC